MWFKLFVLIRIPISVLCLVGYAKAWDIVQLAGLEYFGGAFLLGLFWFLAFASIGLVRQRRGALQLAAWLLALELLGSVGLLVGGDSILLGTFTMRAVVGVACVLVLWTLPNALLFYRWRGLFTGAKKPGL